LSHMPLIIGAQEWQALEAGLIQRADLLEKILVDLYGPQKLVRDGHIPATLIAGAPGFLRPLVGATPKGGHHLHYIAIELARGPYGRWWVLGDRTQAPSGGGYALENRIATSRAMGGDLSQLHVQRLAGFFQAFRQSLGQMRDQASARVGILTPGPFNETYYEQAFLARYLGFLLLEGGDLIMRDNALHVRTVRGLKPLDVLWRRVDANFCDPLELRANSRLGVPGLVKVARQGGLTCVNALGSGLLESRAFMAFMPTLARELLGEDLALPNIATWWRGDKTMAAEADAATGDTVTLSAFGTGLPMDDDGRVHASTTEAHEADLVTQESLQLSTLPTFSDDEGHQALVPRPFSMRVFLARTAQGWQVMPGGFARVSDRTDTRALSMQDGSRSCDVWVCADAPSKRTSLLPQANSQAIRRVPGTLPARAADNLFWLGRYAERAQLSLRLLRAFLSRSADSDETQDALLTSISKQLSQWNIAEPTAPDVFQTQVLPCLESAHTAASSIRDRFSPDAWQTLNLFVARARAGELDGHTTTEQIDEALGMLAAFAGLVGDNMIRLSGWRFLEIGRRMERAHGTCQLVKRFAYPSGSAAPAGAYDLLLEVADSVMSYRQRYSVTTDRDTVVDLVVLDPNNPRSTVFQLEKIKAHIDEITDQKSFEQPSDLQRYTLSMWSNVHTMRVDQLESTYLETLTRSLANLSGMLSSTFITPGETSSTVQV
ncbi:MAG: circularly permuted type 2 ATP-grasp protein, partial [Devosiaceae bacterium]